MDEKLVRVFLVDDDEDDCVLTRDLLAEAKGARFELEWVDTYEAALEAMERAEHHVYLVDYRLGERDGLELLRAAIASGCDAPIIMLTGWGNHTVDVAAMEAGAADYLDKGELRAPLLERSIRYAIERKQAEKALREAEVMRRLSVSRTLVGQMLRDLQNLGGLSEGAMFRAGQELAARVAAVSLPKFLEAFADMGLGTLDLLEADEERRRSTFTGDGLVERRTESGQPTCSYARGFLCGAVAHVLGGKRVAGVEMACQSMGDELCRFVVQVVGE